MPSIVGLLLIALVFYVIYILLTFAFENVGFKRWEASLIVFSSIILGYEWFNIPLFQQGNWIVAINIGGALFPILISLYLMISRKITTISIGGIILVAFVAYSITVVTKTGIVARFPYWLLPPISASLYSVIICMKNKKEAASVAYASGTIGVLIGADILHLQEILHQNISNVTVASIGGAAILDMIFFTGIIAVLIDAFLYPKNFNKCSE